MHNTEPLENRFSHERIEYLLSNYAIDDCDDSQKELHQKALTNVSYEIITQLLEDNKSLIKENEASRIYRS